MSTLTEAAAEVQAALADIETVAAELARNGRCHVVEYSPADCGELAKRLRAALARLRTKETRP